MQNGRWYYVNNETDQSTTTNNLQTDTVVLNDLSLNGYDYLQNKSQRSRKMKKVTLPNMPPNSYYASLRKTNEPIMVTGNSYHSVAELPPRFLKTTSNGTDYIEQLKAQILRKRLKRSSIYSTDSDADAPEQYENKEGRKRLRGPCEDLVWDSFANVTVMRPGKVPGKNSVGIILSLECNAGFKLNIKGENSTARCIRGIWKPETPRCISGKYKHNLPK